MGSGDNGKTQGQGAAIIYVGTTCGNGLRRDARAQVYTGRCVCVGKV